MKIPTDYLIILITVKKEILKCILLVLEGIVMFRKMVYIFFKKMASEHFKLKTCEIKAKTTTKGQIISKGLFGFLKFSNSQEFLI